MKEFEIYILEWILKVTGKNISNTDDVFVIGALDSLNFAELIASIEDNFDIILDFTDLLDWNSLKTTQGISAFIMKQ